MAAEASAEIVAESGDMADDLTEESLSDSVESPESSESSEESYNNNGEESSGSQDSGKRVFASHFRSPGGAT